MMKKVSGWMLWSIMLALLFYQATPLALAAESSSDVSYHNVWYDKYTAYEGTFPYAYYKSLHSSDLGWGASYQLRSYLNIYEVTRDTSWLDKFTLQADTMIANADDIDHDGFLGWATWGYSPIVVDNNGFETANAADPTLPDGWARDGSDASTAFLSSTAKHSGSYGLALKAANGQETAVVQPIKSYVPATKYNLRLYSRITGSVAAKATVIDRTANQILLEVPLTTTNYAYSSNNFFTPEEGHDIIVRLSAQGNGSDGGEADFDEVKVSGWFPYIVHDSMATIPFAEFARLVQDSEALKTSAYADKAHQYVDFIAKNIIPRWEHSNYLGDCWVELPDGTGHYKFPVMDTSGYNSANIEPAYNYNAGIANLYLIMYDLTKNKLYLDRLMKIGKYLKAGLQDQGDSYIWRYWTRPGSNWEDVEHGSLEIGAFLEYYRHGLLFTGEDMHKIANRFTKIMWNQSLTNPVISKYLDGSGGNSSSLYIMNWVELSQFDPTIWKIASEMYRNVTPNHPTHLLVLSLIVKWNPERLLNTGFELDDSVTRDHPAYWQVDADGGKVFMDPHRKVDGAYGLTLQPTGHSEPAVSQTWTDWTPSTAYRLSLDAMTTSAAAKGLVKVYDATTGDILAQAEINKKADWQKYALDFRTPANPDDKIVVILTVTDHSKESGEGHRSEDSGKIHFDNVTMQRLAAQQ
jgi:hypothetical protein